ncbi:hypothetical protein ACG00X_07765 [Roseateles sp. BYS96W]|uniref:Uncharacterized protein n=1 Tax=Pelomonas nitida TaxID=3299027 RepID=A0ABW7G490_9BURK
MTRPDARTVVWTVPVYLSNVLVSSDGNTLASFAPQSVRGSARTPFLTVYRFGGITETVNFGSLYPNLQDAPSVEHQLSWGEQLSTSDNDLVVVRSVRGALFRYSLNIKGPLVLP